MKEATIERLKKMEGGKWPGGKIKQQNNWASSHYPTKQNAAQDQIGVLVTTPEGPGSTRKKD